MTIPIETLDHLDFSDIDSGQRIPATTPGAVLRHDFMEPLGLTAKVLASELGVPANRITKILRGERSVSADTALRLAARFQVSARFWMELQMKHDLAVAQAQRDQQAA